MVMVGKLEFIEIENVIYLNKVQYEQCNGERYSSEIIGTNRKERDNFENSRY